MRSKCVAIFVLLITSLFSCTKSNDSPKTVLSVKVLQDSLPVEGASVTISFTTGETKPEFINRLSDKNGIVNFTGVENKFYKVHTSKNCSYQVNKEGIDMSTVQSGATKSFTSYIFHRGTAKIINNTKEYYEVRPYNIANASQYVQPNGHFLMTYIYSLNDPEIQIQQYTGPYPHPIKSYNLPAICGDTAIITLPWQ